MNHRSSKVVTLSKGTSASALTRNVCPQTTKKSPMSLDTSDVVRDVEITFCSGGRAKNDARRSLEPNRYSLGFPPHLMGVPKGKKSGTFVVDSFQKNASKRAADPGGLKRLQEL